MTANREDGAVSLASSVSVRLPKNYNTPTDRFRYMYFVMMFLGIGTLWPYNMIVSATGYFKEKYPIDTGNIIPMIMQYPSIFILFAMIRYGAKVSFTTRFAVFCPLMATCLAVIPSIASADGSWSFPVLAIVIFVTGVCVAVIQSTSLSFASKFPPIYMQSIMTGQGIAGISVCFVLLFIKYIMPKTSTGAEGYQLFIYVSAVVPLLALALYFGGHRSEFSMFFLCQQRRGMSPSLSLSTPVSESGQTERGCESPRVSHRLIVRKIWSNGLLIALVFIGTFIMFPCMTAALQGSRIGQDWFPLLLITTFNVFDTVGRFSAGFVSIPSGAVLWTLVLARFALYPFFVLHKAGLFVGLAGDVQAFMLEVALSLSNGYLASAIMMRTTSFVDKHEEEASSAAMFFFLVGGILIGLNIAVVLHLLIPAYL